MNTNTTSGNNAASPNHTRDTLNLNWPDDWVTGRVVMQRFGFCERTLRTYVENGLTKHLIGKRQMRFVVREVYEWLVKDGAVRFAAIGLRNICRNQQPGVALTQEASFTMPVPTGMTVAETAQSRPSTISSRPELDTRHSSRATHSAGPERPQSSSFAIRHSKFGIVKPPRCRPGRKPKNPGTPKLKARCRKGNHRWRITAFHRTCVDCGCSEDKT